MDSSSTYTFRQTSGSSVFNCKKAVRAEVKCKEWKELQWSEGQSCLNIKASPSSTRAQRLERLMHDNEKTSSGTFMKWYSTHLIFPTGLHHVRSTFQLCSVYLLEVSHWSQDSPLLSKCSSFFFFPAYFVCRHWCKDTQRFNKTCQDEGSTYWSMCDLWTVLFLQQTLTTKEKFDTSVLVPSIPVSVLLPLILSPFQDNVPFYLLPLLTKGKSRISLQKQLLFSVQPQSNSHTIQTWGILYRL